MTAEDVYKALLAEGADIGLATVYRVLMQFEQAGLLARSNFESGKAVFELNEGQHHDHLVCLTCGRVEEFFDPEIEQSASAPSLKRAASSCRSIRCRSTRAAPRRTASTGTSRLAGPEFQPSRVKSREGLRQACKPFRACMSGLSCRRSFPSRAGGVR